jgi:hypothetical protein
LNDHVGTAIFDIVVANNECVGELTRGTEFVQIDQETEMEFPLYQANLADEQRPWRHDASKLAQAIMDLYQERTGPLVE